MSETGAEMVIGALVPWFGSKRTLATRIVTELGTHRAYWEPFCGSCAVILAKAQTVLETVNDLHGDLVNLARVVQHEQMSVRLFDRMQRSMMHEDLFREAAERFRHRRSSPAPPEPDIDRAADYMLSAWMGRNGVARTQSYNQGYCVRYTANGGHAAARWRSVVESIPAWWERLRNVTVLNRDGFELLRHIDDVQTTAIYLDPPYVTKGASYVHDFEPADHERLRDALRRFKQARVVVSYYDHEVVRRLYDGWTFVDCSMRKSLANGLRQNRGVQKPVTAPEVLVINGPSHTADGLYG